jgi:glycosyltransferase involved in cell wall biosynthesis
MGIEHVQSGKQGQTILLLENSLYKTGAFVSALAVAESLRCTCRIEFVLPTRSVLAPDVVAHGYVCHALPMSEIGRSWKKLLAYLPMLLINAWRLRRLLAQRDVHVLLVNDYYNMLGVMVKLTGWQGTLITMVRLMPANQHPVLNAWWTRLGLVFSRYMVAVSRAVLAQLPQHSKAVAVYDPIEFHEKYPVVLPQDVQSGGGQVRCLYLANYIAGKGHAYALDAFASAYAINPALRLKFVGGDMGLEKNQALKRELQTGAGARGLGEVVEFEGFVTDVEMEIKSADIVLNFSEAESFSRTCVEGAGFGRPVIATRCGGPEEIVEDHVSGLLVDVGCVDQMTRAILSLASNETLRMQMGAAGRMLVQQRFSEEAFVKQFGDMLSDIYKKKRSVRHAEIR